MAQRDQLRPKDGIRLVVAAVARISTEHQDERSLDDQLALGRREVEDRYSGPVQYHVIQGRGSGEYLDRQELLDLEALIESGTLDLVITEDLGRICRRTRAYDLCELCEDYNTRLVAINDHVDTAVPGWQLHAFFSVIRHEQSNRDTSARIRRTLRNRFLQGGALRYSKLLYVLRPGGTTDADLEKRPGVQPLMDEVVQRLENGQSYTEAADWFSDRLPSIGINCKISGAQLAQWIRSGTLKGLRERNRRISQRINRSGRRRCVPAPPEELLQRDCPHLAYIEPARHDRLQAMLAHRNGKFSRGRISRMGPEQNGPRRRSRYPGQHVFCGVCGRRYVWGGHGRKDQMMCNACRSYECWNAATFHGPSAATKIGEAVLREIQALPDFDDQLLSEVRQAIERQTSDQQERLAQLDQQMARNTRDTSNILDAIQQSGGVPALIERLRQLQTEQGEISLLRLELQSSPAADIVLPPLSEVKQLAMESIRDLAVHSSDFAYQMRRLVPKIEVFPVRLCDGGAIVLRARFRLELAAFIDPTLATAVRGSVLSRTVSVDLFEPPQRAVIREAAAAYRAEGLNQDQIAARVNVTGTAVYKALRLHEQMQRLGITDPYVPLIEPPDGDRKFQRHRHPRYRFSPLPNNES